MITSRNARRHRIHLGTPAFPRDENPAGLRRMVFSAACLQPSTGQIDLQLDSFLKERSWNVVENKGSLWKTRERSWNVHENKGS
jgi:hypothetical protein